MSESPECQRRPQFDNDSAGVMEAGLPSPSCPEVGKLVLKYLEGGSQILTADTPNLISLYNNCYQVRNRSSHAHVR
jgi:hypothetical protein